MIFKGGSGVAGTTIYAKEGGGARDPQALCAKQSELHKSDNAAASAVDLGREGGKSDFSIAATVDIRVEDGTEYEPEAMISVDLMGAVKTCERRAEVEETTARAVAEAYRDQLPQDAEVCRYSAPKEPSSLFYNGGSMNHVTLRHNRNAWGTSPCSTSFARAASNLFLSIVGQGSQKRRSAQRLVSCQLNRCHSFLKPDSGHGERTQRRL